MYTGWGKKITERHGMTKKVEERVSSGLPGEKKRKDCFAAEAASGNGKVARGEGKEARKKGTWGGQKKKKKPF